MVLKPDVKNGINSSTANLNWWVEAGFLVVIYIPGGLSYYFQGFIHPGARRTSGPLTVCTWSSKISIPDRRRSKGTQKAAFWSKLIIGYQSIFNQSTTYLVNGWTLGEWKSYSKITRGESWAWSHGGNSEASCNGTQKVDISYVAMEQPRPTRVVWNQRVLKEMYKIEKKCQGKSTYLANYLCIVLSCWQGRWFVAEGTSVV